MKKIISAVTAIAILLTSIIPFTAFAQTYQEELISAGFPQSYAEKLEALHNKYPNWIFKPLQTGLDFNTAVSGERSKHSNQLISLSSTSDTSMFCNCSECFVNGNYVIREGKDWVSASQKAVEYYMDARNFLDEKQIFQFESTAYDGTQTKEGVEAILNGTWMHDSLITYYTTGQSVKTYDNVTKYSDVIMKAASDFGINAYYLASKIRQENGGQYATATAVNGTTAPFEGIYNYYNIGAYSGASDGLAWAAGFLKANKNTVLYSNFDSATQTPVGTATPIASGQYMTWRANKGNCYYVRLYSEVGGKYVEGQSGYIYISDCTTKYLGNTDTGYGRPWTNPYKAIYYGAKYIAKSFANQNSGYLQKFNVSPASTNKYTNEYMKNVSAATSESVTTYNGYSNAGILAMTRTFYIPVFNNMPNDVGQTAISITNASTNSVSLSWTGANNAQAYQVQITDATGNFVDYTYTPATSLTIVNLLPSSIFAVRVRGYYQDGNNIVWGAFAQINLATKPEQVKNVKLSAGDTSVTVNWSPVANATGYRIYIYNSSSKKYELKKTVENPAATSGKLTGLKTNKTYKIKVAAYISVDNVKYIGSKSSAVSVKTKNKSVTLTSAKSSKKKKINVKWKKRSGVSGYEVMWSTTKNFKKNFLSVKVSGSNKTSKTLTTAQSKKDYYVRVRAYKKSGKKYTYYSWSKTIKVKVK